MTFSELIENALRSPQPFEHLRLAATAPLAEGRTPQSVYELFEAVRAQLREEKRQVEEDVVMDAMDCLCGWCSPHQEINPGATVGVFTEPARQDKIAP